MEASAVTAAGSGGSSRRRFRRERLVPLLFLLPAIVFLGVWLVYPTVRTVVRSFFDRDGSNFVGLDNYKDLFTTDTLTTAIKNNVLWVAVVPALVTAIGLVFAVLTERIRWSTGFKTAVFMPMAISLFAAGVIWRVMDEKDPALGTVNASHQGRQGHVLVQRRADRRAGLVGSAGGQPGEGLRAEEAAAGGRRRAARADGDPAGRGAQRRAGGGRTETRRGRDRRHGVARLQAGRRQTGRRGVRRAGPRRRDGGAAQSGRGTVSSRAPTTKADGTFSFGDVGGGSYQVGIAVLDLLRALRRACRGSARA